MLLVNPHTGKTVDAPKNLAEQLKAAGFTDAPTVKPATKPRGRRSTKAD
jgi:hypothetical protein